MGLSGSLSLSKGRFGGGIRVYYTFNGREVVLLLAGGNKRSQHDDIINAKRLAKKWRK